ncbi:DUF910 family protein [Aneurinibacillus sp. Ricciae_BoGa-3]|uniref:YqgQ family protein n=1 Tax=Aneurinibacillus sp. Ricciae_BoGa-3 TaxID=3022697 RepID=UPI0023416CCF|nr:YqgQ family protein [Aneurinibacillus sp. Ricciae_BoGa-3]WCK55693.1 DUF910 family protein [Aneurinibacillus sp. Ricciae_BoGa-3]
MSEIKNILQVRDLLRRFGIAIYTGDRMGDYEMMEDEIRELYKEKLLEIQEFSSAMSVLKREKESFKNR